MAKQPEDWFEEPDALPQEEEDDEIIWVSKSEIKRDAEALKKLGAELVALSKTQLERIPLDEQLLEAILLAQKIKREGLRRQLQLIGKLLRARDPEPITTTLDKLKNRHNQQVVLLHKLEDLRERLVTGDDTVTEEAVALFPHLDRQQLRALIRNAKKEREGNKPPKAYRQLFQYLKELAESA